jgi:protein CMS1
MYMTGQGGDDLEDDLILDEPTVTSGDEEYSHHGSSHGDLSLDDDTSRPSGSAAHAESGGRNKRKRSGKDNQKKLKVRCLDFKPVNYPNLDMIKQKPKLKETQDEKYPLIALQSPLELAGYLAGSQAKSFSRLSRIELEDIQIPGVCGLR